MQSADVQWVVLELTAKAENEDPDVVRASIRHHIRDAEIFIPASVVQRGDQRVYHYLMEGYAFIQDKHPLGHYARLEDTKYVQGPLYVPTGNRREKKLATVPQSQIDRLRSQIKVEVDQGIEIGDTVIIISGPYKNISAIVKEEIAEHDSVAVHIQLRSTDRVVTLPRAFLRLERKSPMVVFRPRLEAISLWAKTALRLLQWPNNRIDTLTQAVAHYERWDKWLERTRAAYRFVQAYYYTFDLDPLLDKWSQFEKLRVGGVLQQQVFALSSPMPDMRPVVLKHKDFQFLAGAHRRISTIYLDVKRMTQTTPVNLIIDGTQLFIRCAEAPGLGALTDSKGRPTGAVVGFLRGLGSYRKRFPGATLYVCWDGSSQRRKALYPEYKANRVSRSGQPSFGIDWLREVLPMLGVHQAYHPEEEADDVMATLVRGPLQGAPNVLVTTDRDMLQLVSEFTHQLCPAVGAGKEKLYDPALVAEEYGVAPESMVHIRALSGDSSDNIPGVHGFGLKSAAKVVRLYGTVSALLKSNLAGLGKAQVAKLRASEQQILQNVELLRLRDVAFHHIESNPNQSEVEARLKELEIKPDPILAAFFPKQLTTT